MPRRLLKSEKIRLHELISENGLNPSEFEWIEEERLVKILYRKYPELFFSFSKEQSSNGFQVKYYNYVHDEVYEFFSSSIDRIFEVYDSFLYNQVKTYESELLLTDPWSDPLPISISNEFSEQQFTDVERERVRDVFKNQLEPSLKDALELSSAQLKYLTEKFDLFLTENENKSKGQFRNEAIKLIMKVSVDLGLSAAKCYITLQLLGKAFELLKPILLLPH